MRQGLNQRIASRILQTGALFLLALLVTQGDAWSQEEAEWIWSPEHEKEQVPLAPCHFRRSFTLRSSQLEQCDGHAETPGREHGG